MSRRSAFAGQPVRMPFAISSRRRPGLLAPAGNLTLRRARFNGSLELVVLHGQKLPSLGRTLRGRVGPCGRVAGRLGCPGPSPVSSSDEVDSWQRSPAGSTTAIRRPECAATFRLEETCQDEVTMKSLHLAPFAAFAMLAACSADVPNPLVPITEQASIVPKPGAHFQRADAELSGANLVVSFREVGLGEGDVTVVASADATADYACLNRGGEFPNDPKKQSLSGPVSATGVFPVAKNGHIEGTLTVLPPASTLECP